MSRHTAVLYVIIFVAAFLRFFHLTSFSFSGDEWYSYQNAQNYLDGNFESGFYSFLYFGTLALIKGFLGFSVLGFRSVAVVYGVLSVVVAYFLGKEIGGRNVGLLSAFLMAISSYHIEQSQDTRYYTQFCFYTSLSLLFYHRYVFSLKRRSDILTWLLATALNLFSHILSVFVTGGQVAHYLIRIWKKRTKMYVLFGGLVVGVLGIVVFREWIFNTILHFTERSAILRQGMMGFSLSTFLKLPFSLFIFVFGSDVSPLWFWFVIPLTVVHGVLIGKGIAHLYRERRLVFWSLVSGLPLVVLYWLIAPLSTPGFTNLEPRHAIFAYPVWLVLVALGIEGINRKAIKYVTVAGIFLSYGFVTYQYFYPVYAYNKFKYIDFERPGQMLEKYSFDDPLFILDGRSKRSFLLYNSQYVKDAPVTDPWDIPKMQNERLMRHDAVIMAVNSWKAYGKLPSDQDDQVSSAYSVMLKRLQEHFVVTDGFVQYPLYFYVFEKRSRVQDLAFPVEFTDLRYLDLSLPLQLDGTRTLGSMLLAPGDSVRIELSNASSSSRLTVYYSLEDTRTVPKEMPVGELEIQYDDGTVSFERLRKGINAFDSFAEYYDEKEPDSSDVAFSWVKYPLMSGSMKYDGVYAEFPAYIYKVSPLIKSWGTPHRLIIRYDNPQGGLRLWAAHLDHD